MGGLAVSGDTSCTDHIVAWKKRHALNFDDLPAMNQTGFGHPACDSMEAMTTAGLPPTFPVGPNP